MKYIGTIISLTLLAACTKDIEVPVNTGNKLQLTAGAAFNITQSTAQLYASVSAPPSASTAVVTNKGVVYSTLPNPYITNFSSSASKGTGDFSISFTGLQPNKKYYVRTFAVIAYTGAIYGNQIEFTTLAVTQATITSSGVTSITKNSAVFTNNVTAAGGGTISARGVCWSTSPSPTTANSYTLNGSGTGSFSASLTGLAAGTTYYTRAYATNEAGTTYGPAYSFKTLN